MSHADADRFRRRPHACCDDAASCSGACDALLTDAALGISRREQRLQNFLSEINNAEPEHTSARESWTVRKRSLFSVMEADEQRMGKRSREIPTTSGPTTGIPTKIESGNMKTAGDERQHETRSLFEILSSCTPL